MRLWPRSLAGQLALVLVAGTLLAQVAGVIIVADERRFALQGLRREQVLERVATLVELLAATPPALHEKVVHASRTAQTQLWLSPEPSVESLPERGRGWARRRLTAMLGAQARTVRIAWQGALGPRWRPWRGWAEDDDRRHHPGGRTDPGGGPARLEIAVELEGGDWLNARTVLLPPPFVPAGAALVSALLTALVIAAAVILGVRRILRPLRGLADAADRLGRGEAVPALPPSGPTEIRATTSAFNLMQDRLGRFVADRTRMLAAIGHDLRTPLTTLRLRAEFVEDEETRTRILATVEEMQRMVEATLAFTREEASSEPTRRVELGALVDSVCADLADLGQPVVLAPAAPLILPCRPVSLKRAVRNLVLNAVTYGGVARVAIAAGDGRVRITVEDDGPGIPEAELERVFEPFTRLEPSRSTATGGQGLGLAIARSIARAHGGDVRLANRPQGGLSAEIALPLPEGFEGTSS